MGRFAAGSSSAYVMGALIGMRRHCLLSGTLCLTRTTSTAKKASTSVDRAGGSLAARWPPVGARRAAGRVSRRRGATSRTQTGKEGSTVPRHLLNVLNGSTLVPLALAAGSATTAAAVLCSWLEALRREREEDFLWLLEKWMFASERERGRMRLVGQSEVERAGSLADGMHVKVIVEPARLARRDQTRGSKRVLRMRIKCLDARGKPITRDTTAVRWVMTYVAARWGSDERTGKHVQRTWNT